MFWQYIIVFAIIGAASYITLYRLYHFFTDPGGHCNNCALHSSNGMCALKGLRNDIAAKK